METIETNQKGNPMNRKLQINAAICDVSKVTEKTLEAYDRISVNAAQLITSKQARELLSRIRFTANTADTMETIEGAVMSVQNGEYTIKAGQAPQPRRDLVPHFLGGDVDILAQLEGDGDARAPFLAL